MSAMKRLKRTAEQVAGKLDEPHLSVAPLIDICFLLLIYFMVTTTIKPAERDVAAMVPSREGAAAQRSLEVMIMVRADGAILVNPGVHELIMSMDPKERELPKLEDHLTMLMIGSPELPPVMVRAEGGAQHQRVVDVMNLLRKIGWTRVAFVDDPDEE